ncbi:MAG: mechanosensitive ion channel domain-containing protein [Rhodanobacteraceae bacterium]
MQWLNSLQGVDWKTLAVTASTKVIGALLILLIGLYVVKWIARLTQSGLTRVKVEPTAAQFLRNVAYAVLMVLLVLTVLSVIGVPMTSAFAVLGAAGLAIGLALKDSLSNIASGVMLVTLRPFKVGDIVNINKEAGKVESVSIFQTCLRGPDNQTIVLPNSLITSNSIINMTPDVRRRVELVIGIDYGADIAAARSLALEIIHADERVLDEPAADVLVYSLGDNSVNLGIRCHVANNDYFATRCELTERIKVAFDDNGIGIPFPQRDVHLYHHAAKDGGLIDPRVLLAGGREGVHDAALNSASE